MSKVFDQTIFQPRLYRKGKIEIVKARAIHVTVPDSRKRKDLQAAPSNVGFTARLIKAADIEAYKAEQSKPRIEAKPSGVNLRKEIQRKKVQRKPKKEWNKLFKGE